MLHLRFTPQHLLTATGQCRLLPVAPLPRCCCRAAVVRVRCSTRVKKSKKASSAKRQRTGRSKGFGGQPQSDWEADLLHPYRTYYKQGYKPPRWQGALQPHTFEDGSVGIINQNEVIQGELLAVSHPIALLDGTLGAAPPVEDLHVALLEADLKPGVRKVLTLLPRRPLLRRSTPPAAPAATAPAAAEQEAAAAGIQRQQQQGAAAAAPDTASTGSSSDTGSSSTSAAVASSSSSSSAAAAAAAAGGVAQLTPEQLYGGEVPQEMVQLLPTFWEEYAPAEASSAPVLGSKVLMRLLQASCWSEDFRDPAASQVRHERPLGFIGVWPEFALLRHSCAPNSSVTVVDRYMFIHAVEDIPAGGEVTFNKLGSAVTGPLASRQAAHQQLFGRPCHCRRCTLEASLPPDVAEALTSVADSAQGEWMSRWQSLMEGAATMDQEELATDLTDLQSEVAEALLDLEGALQAAVPDRLDQLVVGAAAYAAYDLAWNMEELLMEAPDLDKLSNCVALLRVFARGTEQHLWSSMTLQQAHSQRIQALDKQVQGAQYKTAASQRRLTQKISKMLAAADVAAQVYSEAVFCRYGLIPEEGLLPQLEEGLGMFYAGLSALDAAQSEGLQEVPEVSRDMVVDGIPVTVTDTVDGSAFAGAAGGEAAGVDVAGRAGPRLTVEVVDDVASGVAAEPAAAGNGSSSSGGSVAAGEQQPAARQEPEVVGS